MQNFQALNQAVVEGNRAAAVQLTQQMLDEGVSPSDIVDNALVPGMNVVGERFKRNEIFVPEMLIAARAMKQAMELIEPLLTKAGIKPTHTVIIGTVQGDLHDIGKNLVAMMFKGANFGVIDLGTNVPAQRFVDAAKESGADLVALSALLTTTMPAMKSTVEALRSQLNGSMKIIIGGAPITQSFADEIGADGYAPDAASAVDRARELAAV